MVALVEVEEVDVEDLTSPAVARVDAEPQDAGPIVDTSTDASPLMDDAAAPVNDTGDAGESDAGEPDAGPTSAVVVGVLVAAEGECVQPATTPFTTLTARVPAFTTQSGIGATT
jgi:hypothetical protein